MSWFWNNSNRAIWMVLLPAFAIWAAATQPGDWIAKTLIVLAGLSWFGVLLSSVIRHAVVPFAGAIAALSGGLLSLFLADPLASAPKNAGELGLVLFALALGGSAALFGQVANQRESRTAERQLRDQVISLQRMQLQLLTEQTELKEVLERVGSVNSSRRRWRLRH